MKTLIAFLISVVIVVLGVMLLSQFWGGFIACMVVVGWFMYYVVKGAIEREKYVESKMNNRI